METVPKIVRERLAAAAPAADHPDANLLAAFAEHSLPAGERTVVLEHLARCADCRDVIALALPETEAATLLPRPARGGWLSWPALRWGLVAAGVVTIAAFGIMQLQHRQQTATVAKQEAPRLGAPVAESKSQPAAVPAAAANAREENDESAKLADSVVATNAVVLMPKGMARAKTPPAPVPEKSSGGAIGGAVQTPSFRVPLHSGPAVANQWQQNAQYAQNNSQSQNSNSAAASPAARPPAVDIQNGKALPTLQDNEAQRSAVSVEAEGRGASAGVILGQAQKDAYGATPLQPKPAVPAAAGARPSGQTAGQQALRQLALQPAPGQMGGYVVDPSGAAIPNTRVTVSSANGTVSAVTDSQGRWLIAGLPSGNYKAQATAPGFQTMVRDFSYDASQPSLYRFPLSLGTVSETVAVAAESPQLQTESADAGTLTTSKQVSQLPVNGRNFTQLATISPGVVPPGVIPRWSINSTGGLQRSIDQGSTWQDVSVVPASTSSHDLAVFGKSSATKSKEADKKSLKRGDKAVPIVFRAVAANGTDVWAGGMAGVLYHSLDAGNTWTRVLPFSANATLTGDILTLDFPDPQHGKLTTSTPEVWTTSDDGQTWQRQ